MQTRWKQRLAGILEEWITVKSEQLDLLRRQDIDTFLSTNPGEDWINRYYERLAELGKRKEFRADENIQAKQAELIAIAEEVVAALAPYQASLHKDVVKANLKLQMWRQKNRDND